MQEVFINTLRDSSMQQLYLRVQMMLMMIQPVDGLPSCTSSEVRCYVMAQNPPVQNNVISEKRR